MSDTIANTPATSDTPKIGEAWGDDISEERKAELDAILAAWEAETDHGERTGPFDPGPRKPQRIRLTGADAFYLAACALVGTKPPVGDPITDLSTANAAIRNPAMHAFLDLSALHLQHADLHEAKLTGANLHKVELMGANLGGAQLARADLSGAWLTSANLRGAQLEHADLGRAQLERASLYQAELRDADLRSAQLTGANLSVAQLTRANLGGAQLMGAYLAEAQLIDANLRFSRLDRDTRLSGVNLASVSLDQIILDNTNLTVVSWEGVAPLGDEKGARAAKDENGKRKSRKQRIEDYEAAVRANRLLATALRAQGLNEESDTFAFRAQIMQRKLNFRRRRLGRWLVSWGLAAMAGYGYRLWRIFFAYGLVLTVFSLIFWALGVHSFADAGAEPWYQALWDSFLVSLSAIHGRAVFEQLGAWTPTAWVAAIESVVGIVIEGVFVAMLIQRLFR